MCLVSTHFMSRTVVNRTMSDAQAPFLSKLMKNIPVIFSLFLLN